MANDDATALAAANLVGAHGNGRAVGATFPAPASIPTRTSPAEPTASRRGDSGVCRWPPQDQRFTYFVDAVDDVDGPRRCIARSMVALRESAGAIPVYFPDEALLIKAEALANQNQLAAAQAALDSVRTDCTGGRGVDDPKACLPALLGQLTQTPAARGDLCAAPLRAVRHGTPLGGRASTQRHPRTDAAPAVPDRRTALLAAVRARRPKRQSQRNVHRASRSHGAGGISRGLPRAVRPTNMMRNLQIVARSPLSRPPRRAERRTPPSPLAPSGPTGRVRFVNMITDTTRGRVNAILEGVPFGVNLTYGQSTPATLPAPSTANYSAILAGNRTMLLKRTADTTKVVATVAFTVGSGRTRRSTRSAVPAAAR